MEIRYERKWKVPSNQFVFLNRALRESKFSFKEHFKERWVNSIYFDDMFNKSIYQNLDGIQKKCKVRLRWYGNKNIITNPNIEIKKKNGFTVLKEKTKIVSNKKKITKNVLLDLTFKLKKKYPILLAFNPVSYTHYLRYYYISQDQKVRATIDKNISYRKINNFTGSFSVKKDENIILELKYGRDHDTVVRNSFSKKNKLRLSRNSKFINSLLNI